MPMQFFILLLLNVGLFILGNYVYTLDIVLILKVLSSELCFICLYTFLDKGNITYGWTFTITSLVLATQFFLPIYSPLFFSNAVQYFSVSISMIAIIVNSLVIRKLLSRGFAKIFSSRISSIMASAAEIACFSYLLGIGLSGAAMTVIVRIIYITIIPKIVFYTKQKK